MRDTLNLYRVLTTYHRQDHIDREKMAWRKIIDINEKKIGNKKGR
jgi:hypothetical protein